MALVSYWVCQECHEVIPRDDLRIVREENRHWWLDDCPVEVSYSVYCPYCGSEWVEEAEYCEGCGEPCDPKDLEYGLCEVCRKEKETAMRGGA